MKSQGVTVVLLILTQVTQLKILLQFRQDSQESNNTTTGNINNSMGNISASGGGVSLNQQTYSIIILVLIWICISLEIITGLIIIHTGNLGSSRGSSDYMQRPNSSKTTNKTHPPKKVCTRCPPSNERGNYRYVNPKYVAEEDQVNLFLDESSDGDACCTCCSSSPNRKAVVEMEDYAETIASPVSAHVGPPQLTEKFDDAIQVNIMKSETSDVMAAGSTLEAAGQTKLIGMQTALEHGRFVSIMQSTCDQTAKEETSLSRASSWQNLITYLMYFVILMNICIAAFGISVIRS